MNIKHITSMPCDVIMGNSADLKVSVHARFFRGRFLPVIGHTDSVFGVQWGSCQLWQIMQIW